MCGANGGGGGVYLEEEFLQGIAAKVPLALLCAGGGAAIKHLTASKFDHANNSKYAPRQRKLSRAVRAVINLSANNSFY